MITTNVKPIPDGYHSLTPYLIIKDAPKAIEFYKKVFEAKERLRLDTPDGKLMHAELEIGDSVLMLADEYPEMNVLSPKSVGGASVCVHLYVKDVDVVFNRAISAGSESLRPVADQFFGDRSGSLMDPFGHMWSIATHKEDVSPQEMDMRFKFMMQQQKK